MKRTNISNGEFQIGLVKTGPTNDARSAALYQESRLADKGQVSTSHYRRPTLVEKSVGIFPLSYTLSSVIWAFIFTMIIEFAPLFTPNSNRADPAASVHPGDALHLSIVFLIYFSIPLLIRITRFKIEDSKRQLITLLPEGERDFTKAFSPAFSYLWHIIVFVVVMGLLIPNFLQYNSDPFNQAIAIVGWGWGIFLFSCLASLYFGTVLGLFKISGKQLTLKSYREDPKMGTKPVASLSLVAALAYFSVMAAWILMSAVSPYDSPRSPDMLITEAILIVAGLVLFFLPTYRIHLRMVEEKSRQLSLIRSQFHAVSHDPAGDGNGNSLLQIKDSLLQIKGIISSDLDYRLLQPTSTWPFGTSTLSKLAAISLTVIAAMLARIVIAALNL